METTAASQNSTNNGPGSMLQRARLDLKLAPEDVAQILRLSPRQIVALENDDYAHLPGPTYVRGYLRGYAQMLGLSPEAVLAAYARLPAATPHVDLTKLSPEPQISSDHHVMRFATFGVLALVFGLALAWWLGRDEVVTRPKPVEVGKAPDVSAPVTTDQPAPGAPEPDKMASAVPAPEAKPAAPAAAPAPAVKPATPPTPAAPATAPVVATGPRVRLVLTMNQESWADIRDGQQNKLLYETVPAGRTVPLEGLAPVSVFLGNVDGVSVEVNGKPFDVAPYKRGMIARFTVNAPAEPNAQR